MAELVRKRRTAARGWATRAQKSLLELLASKDITRVALRESLGEVDRRLQALDSVQAEFELELEDEAIEEEIEGAFTFRNGILTVKTRALELLESFDVPDPVNYAESVVGSAAGSESQPNIAKLPKLDLPKFSGKILEWTSFWDQFLAIIDKASMADVNKFAYLRSLLEGEAANAIAGLSLTDSNYETATDILTQRYGRKELVRFSHIQELLSLAPLGRQASLSELKQLRDKLLSHIRSLENLGINGQEYGVFLTPLVLSCLPPNIRMEWAKVGEGHEGDINFLIDTLDTQIENRERCDTFKNLLKPESKVEKFSSDTRVKRSTVVALTSGSMEPLGCRTSNVEVEICNICARKHRTSKCWELVRVPVQDRLAVLRRKGLCYRCLDRGHLSPSCIINCEKCKGKHHFLLCGKRKTGAPNFHSSNSSQGSEAATPNTSHVGVATASKDKCVLLQILSVLVSSPHGPIAANVLLDSGSDRSYVSKEFVQKAQPAFRGSESVACATFGTGNIGKTQLRNVYSLELQGAVTGRASLVATEVDAISAPVFSRKVSPDILKSFSHLKLNSNYEENRRVKIDILVGLDSYWQLVLPEFDAHPSGLVAQNTIFGWVLSGAMSSEKRLDTFNHQLLCICDVTDSEVRHLWDIDLMPEKVEPDSIMRDFENSISQENGRYVVALPWADKSRKNELLDNFEVAVQRLKSLDRKLERDPELLLSYNSVLHDMEESGIIEEIPSGEMFSKQPTFYLPHRPVVRETSTSTKVRPVFDASAKGANNLSLNDLMEKGPNLIPNLVEILIRFRRWPIALVADIQKAFLQISVRKQDQDVHRFLWLLDGAVRVMKLVRVPFGNRSSPFLLNATIKHHLSKYGDSRVTKELRENLYVDDWLSGADDVLEAKQMVSEASSILVEAGMILTKWGSNCKLTNEVSFGLTDKRDLGGSKILGLHWNRLSDCFYFEGLDLTPHLVLTKRLVLGFIARLFDPLGFLTPFTIRLKCLFQELWKEGINWDSLLEDHHCKVVEDWLADLLHLKLWNIPRSFSSCPWKEVADIQLHAFSDASEKAYGACVYAVITHNDRVTSSLVISKAKVAPLKKVTLPRLELLGAVIAAQLLDFVRQTLSLNIDCCYGWTDSMVVLSWIKGDPVKWKPFVGNRVADIQNITNPSQWSHCKGSENPADLLSRGVSAQSLMTSVWLKGPDFLTNKKTISCDEVPKLETQMSVIAEEMVDPSEVNYASALVVKLEEPLIDLNLYGNWEKGLAVMAWILRFVHNCQVDKSKRQAGLLCLEELERAKLALFQAAQKYEYPQEIQSLRNHELVSKKSSLYKLSPFLDEMGLLHVRTRLDFADISYAEKCPIIIPKGRLAELLVQFQHILLKHAGVNLLVTSLRSSYWIIGIRRLAKKVKRQCFLCQRIDSKACTEPCAPLPPERVRPAAPFSVIGVDHAGPLFCADVPGKKFYILLITCAVVRAIHLELVSSLNVEQCFCAMRKFIARRGLPRVIYSDNAQTFKATHKKLLHRFKDLCPDWKFIVPKAPWWGGWWERLVRTVKGALRKSVGIKNLTQMELDTVLIEIEACINSRPLTTSGNGNLDSAPLTPAHFLIGRSGMYEPVNKFDCNTESNSEALVERYSIQLGVLSQFWDVWCKDYLLSLPVCSNNDKGSNISEGSVVLIREENLPRLSWPLGVVVQLYPGKDKIVRSCKVRVKGSEFVRPIQKLHNLESTIQSLMIPPSLNSQQTADSTTDSNVKYSRYGRAIKKVQKLNL